LFIGVTLYMPHGVVGLIQKLSTSKNTEERV